MTKNLNGKTTSTRLSLTLYKKNSEFLVQLRTFVNYYQNLQRKGREWIETSETLLSYILEADNL